MSKRIKLTFLILVLALVGCKTNNGINQMDQSAKAMRNRFDVLKAAPDRITAVTKSLDELITVGGDMRSEFRTFDKNVNRLISHRNQISSLRAKVDSSRDTFNEAWKKRQQTIKNDEIRARSKKRHNAVIAMFEKVNGMAAEAKAEFEPWMQNLLDVRTYLESDLNTNGVASIADLAAQISADAEPIKKKITILLAELNTISNAIVPTTSSPNSKNK